MPTSKLLLGALLVAHATTTLAAESSLFSVETTEVDVGGQRALQLVRNGAYDETRPHVLSVDVLPGRGMNVFRIRAFVPGQGVVDVLASPPLDEAPKLMNKGPDDIHGLNSTQAGGAILVPFANRIRGQVQPDGQHLKVDMNGQQATLIANHKGKQPGAEPHAMHGFLLDKPADELKLSSSDQSASVEATYHGGDFGGQWPSRSDVDVNVTLNGQGVDLNVTIHNVGNQPMPAAVGWHPYLAIPSGQREQARVQLPTTQRAEVDNYDNVFPTGKLMPMSGAYAFNTAGGHPLGATFFDDTFYNVQRNTDGQASAEVRDPAARYGVRLTALSPEIKVFQMYSPKGKPFVAIEPQYNLGDPFGAQWQGVDTGMVMVKPGESTTYHVKLELFQP